MFAQRRMPRFLSREPQEQPGEVVEFKPQPVLNSDDPPFNPTEAEAQLHSLNHRIDRLKASISQRNMRHQAAIDQIKRAHAEETAGDEADLAEAKAAQHNLRSATIQWAIDLDVFEGIEALDLKETVPPAITNEEDTDERA